MANSTGLIFGEGMMLISPIISCLFNIVNRSIHNVRIEQLWVDITAQVGAYWAEFFIELELHHSLDTNNINHIWLLQHLFLQVINNQLMFWADSWNQHKLQIQNGPSHSPADLFVFDMLMHGVQGSQLPNEEFTEEELEFYGVDWEGLHDNQLLQAQGQNNPMNKEGSSWVGRSGLPPHLNEVSVEPPTGLLTEHNILALDHAVKQLYQFLDDDSRRNIWAQGLGHARVLQGTLF